MQLRNPRTLSNARSKKRVRGKRIRRESIPFTCQVYSYLARNQEILSRKFIEHWYGKSFTTSAYELLRPTYQKLRKSLDKVTNSATMSLQNINKMNKIQSILSLFDKAQVVTVDDSPYLHSVSVAEINGQPDNEVVCASWRDEEYEYCVKFTEEGLSQATLLPSGILTLPDHEGSKCHVAFYSLQNDLAGVCQNDLEEGKV